MPAYTRLRGITEWGNSELSKQLSVNLESWLDWSLLGIGAFTNVVIPTSGAYGSNFEVLKLVKDPNYTLGRVWQAVRQDWVWETGVDYGTQPIRVSGVYVNNTFYPITTSGAYSHVVNYPDGKIIFNSAIPVTSTVKAEYSYRSVNVCDSNIPWFKEVMPHSLRVDDLHFTQVGSGAWAVLAQNRVQLPAVVIEPSPRHKARGLCLGGGQWVEKDVCFHVFAETDWERDKLIDAIAYQKHMTLLSFNVNTVVSSDKMPLNDKGSPISGAIMYPDLVAESGEFFWKKMFIKDTNTQEVAERPPLFQGLVRATFEIDFPELC